MGLSARVRLTVLIGKWVSKNIQHCNIKAEKEHFEIAQVQSKCRSSMLQEEQRVTSEAIFQEPGATKEVRASPQGRLLDTAFFLRAYKNVLAQDV